MATISDADGRPLAEAELRCAEDSPVVTLESVDYSGPLLGYYFGRGERRVMVEVGGTLVPGQLDTHWQGAGRAWWVTLEAETIADPAPTASRQSTESLPVAIAQGMLQEG